MTTSMVAFEAVAIHREKATCTLDDALTGTIVNGSLPVKGLDKVAGS